ncbi:hypothetical protein BCY91_13485 [Pelobium manganitolerans]|uniref:DUF2975 domain-containing protein n=1 Tax=Pelobium manganitolerans TaxID=1842495 RepID=A0A419SAW5_9SPHI|nr:DUF2975 domain-containing protein [Pelobium manganitolerans]RKD19601.1 hypothetical protein BCY91_13485 [Pelobium manganitolerans]
MSKRRSLSQLKSFFGPPSTAFNPTWKAYRILFAGIFLLGFSFWNSYDKYRHQHEKKVAIENVHKSQAETNTFKGRLLEVSQKSELLLKPKSLGQQMLFDLDPNSENIFSFSFTWFFFVVTLGLFILIKNTPEDFKFSHNTLSNLNRLHFLVYASLVIKVVLVFQYNSYIRGLMPPGVRLAHSMNNQVGTFFFFGMFSVLLITVINFFKRGLSLQEEQDLTV